MAGVVAIKVANRQINAARIRSFSDVRREKIEEAVQVLVSLDSRLRESLPFWIETSQSAEVAKQNSNGDALDKAADQLRCNALRREIPDDIIRVATLFELYMEIDQQKASRDIVQSFQNMMADSRAKGQNDKSAYLLTTEILNEFAQSTQVPTKLLLDAARSALRN